MKKVLVQGTRAIPPTPTMKEVIRAELTWTGERMERGVSVFIDEGKITKVIVGDGDSSGVEGPSHDQSPASQRDLGWKVRELKGQALLPGLVNCHSHAFQRALRGKGETYDPAQTDSFWTWRQDMYKLASNINDDVTFLDTTRKCFDEMKRAGITCVGEFHYFHHSPNKKDFAHDLMVVKAAQSAGIRLVLLNAFYCFGGFENKPLAETQQRFETDSVDEYFKHMDNLISANHDPKITFGVVAHSLRAVSNPQLAALHQGALQRNLPFHLHIEEQPKEVEDCKLANQGRTPMRVLLDTVAVNHLTTAVHCNHTKVDELREFVERGGNVCICPLTEGNLGDGVMKDLQSCVSSVCLGSDCNARIDLLEEMRWLEYSQRLQTQRRGVCTLSSPGDQVSAAKELFKLATVNGARSLNLPVGGMQPGNLADFASIDLSSSVLDTLETEAEQEECLLGALIFGAGAREVITGTCVGGSWSFR